MSKHFKLIGDPHITRKFEFGVPLARKGERERLLMEDFRTRLNTGDERIIIMVGDLFEKPICTLRDLYQIMGMLISAANTHPHKTFVMMAGNHDISPQANNPGAFDILCLMDEMLPNLIITKKPRLIEDIALFPWEWNRTALEQLEDLKYKSFNYAVGHWDLVMYDEEHVDHMCPSVELMAMGAKELFSGHWHVAGEYKVRGVPVTCTGSMQPMTHAEDPDNTMYITMTTEEYEDADPDDYKNMYVRVLADDGEEVSDLPDCLGFKVQRKVKTQPAEEATVSLEGFNLQAVIDKNLMEFDVPDSVAALIKEKLNVDD